MTRRFRLAALLLIVLAPAARAQDAAIIYVDEQKAPQVKLLDAVELRQSLEHGGLLIWKTEGQGERWEVVPKGWSLPVENPFAPPGTVALGATRSAGTSPAGTQELGQMTLQLDQLRGAVVARDINSSFLTPSREGRLLNPKLTVWRMPRKEGKPYPAAEATLTARGKQAWTIPFAEGQAKLAWNELPALAKAHPDGLPPGQYTLQLKAGGPPTAFAVEPTDLAQARLRPLRDMAALVKDRKSPLSLLFALDHLLSYKDDAGVPLYLADALDQFEGVDVKALPTHLRQQRDRLVAWLETEPQFRDQAVQAALAPGQPTGIKEIDAARQLIAQADWQEAMARLKDKAFQKRSASDPRARGLALLYQAVIQAESGLAREAEVRQTFEDALEALQAAQGDDQQRAYNNYADYLQQLAQDHLYNHALRLAAGVESPFASALAYWVAARDRYEVALKLAAKNPEQRAAVLVNQARLYALLGDIVHTLDTGKQFPEGEEAVNRQAAALARRAGQAREPLLGALALELRASLAYRAGDSIQARKLAEEALQAYLDAGYLAGVENLQRLLGLTAAAPDEALRHFRVAHLISEALRRRLPPDRVGATQAGFFARKAWVVERMVELLLQQGKHAEALQTAELAKARALQDLLVVGRAESEEAGPRASGQLDALLQDWPRDVVALEYFLGQDRAYVFVVAGGQVRAYPLQDAQGRPVAPRELIARVHRFLREVEGQATKMYNRVLAGKGFDHQWQDELHTLYRQLLPAEAIKAMRQAKTVVIVPQHILHYFPFAALVTEKDARKLAAKEMPRPKFLLDEPFTLVNAPSLAAWDLLRRGKDRPIQQVNVVGLVQAPGADPLPGVDEDLKNLREAFGPAVKNFYDNDRATAAVARKLIAQPGLLFFGTHGFNDADRPLDSFLIFLPREDGKGKDDDGKLTARAIFQDAVKADLVVMSACYSGLGDRSPLPGDDLYGLQRAFLQSGARTVVAGLWDVYDGTAPELMKGFFQRAAQGEPAARALAESQRAFLNRLRNTGRVEPWLHPYFWAVYNVVGDDRTHFGPVQ